MWTAYEKKIIIEIFVLRYLAFAQAVEYYIGYLKKKVHI